MTTTTADCTLTAVLELDDDSLPQAAVGTGPLPTLDERVAMFLRAVDGAREFTADERRAARDRILDAMAADMASETNSGTDIERADTVSSPVDVGQPARPTFGGAAAVPTRGTWRPVEMLSGLLRDLLILPVGPAAGPRMAAMALVALLVFGAGWSGTWLYSARKAETAFAAWSDDSGSGRLFRCGSRSLGGFPFRIELRCEDPQLTFSTAHSETVLKADQLLANASILRPGAVNTFITGPLSIKQSDQSLIVAHWARAQTSIRDASERMSLQVDGLRFERVTQGVGETIAMADHLEFEAHRTSVIANAAFDINAHLIAASIAGGPAIVSRPFLAEIAAVLHGGERLEVSNARIKQGEAVAVAQGDVGLDRNGNLRGALRLRIADSERFAQLLRRNGGRNETGFDRLADWLAAARPDQLALADRTRPPDRNLIARPERPTDRTPRTAPTVDEFREIPVRLTDEGVFVGPVLLGKLPVLFE
jgi:hypothetical protein